MTISIFFLLASNPFLDSFFCIYVLYLVIFKVTTVQYTKCKAKYGQKPEKTAILAALRRKIKISKKFK